MAGYGPHAAGGPPGPGAGARPGDPATGPAPGGNRCPSCGLAAEAADRYCESCGYALVDAARPVVAERAPRRLDAERGGTRAVCSVCETPSIGPDGWCDRCGRPFSPRDHVEIDHGVVASVSNRGLRHRRNEDSAALNVVGGPHGDDHVVAVVCDGVSSSPRPDEASAIAAQTACGTMSEALAAGSTAAKAMAAGVAAAASAVARMTTSDDAGNAPACTLVSAIVASGEITVGWVGDSRAYWLADPDGDADAPAADDDTLPGAVPMPPVTDPRDRTPETPAGAATARTPSRLLTEDDSWATRMIAIGAMTEAEAYADRRAHAIVSWLGADAGEVRPRVIRLRPSGPGALLLCSDGLWNYLQAAPTLAAMALPTAYTHPLESARRLTGFAIDSGGADNITVALVPVPPAPPAEPETPAERS